MVAAAEEGQDGVGAVFDFLLELGLVLGDVGLVVDDKVGVLTLVGVGAHQLIGVRRGGGELVAGVSVGELTVFVVPAGDLGVREVLGGGHGDEFDGHSGLFGHGGRFVVRLFGVFFNVVHRFGAVAAAGNDEKGQEEKEGENSHSVSWLTYYGGGAFSGGTVVGCSPQTASS